MTTKWHGKQCPICFSGTLLDGERDDFAIYAGERFSYRSKGAFCDACGDGIVEYSPEQDRDFEAFRNARERDKAP